MPHDHVIYDQDPHFKIDGVSRTVTNASETKAILFQHDHNSERYTFELPRYIDGHDMTLCDIVQIHYLNTGSSTNEKVTGIYEVDDIHVSDDDENTAVFSWLISRNCTQQIGAFSFAMRFACTDESGDIIYEWNTAVHSKITVSASMRNSETIVEEYADIIEQWKTALFGIPAPTAKVEKTETGIKITCKDNVNGETSVEYMTDPQKASDIEYGENSNVEKELDVLIKWKTSLGLYVDEEGYICQEDSK